MVSTPEPVRIQFANPQGLHGTFSTVRVGDVRLTPGLLVHLVDGDGHLLATARVADCWRGDLAAVPAAILEMEQEPLARTYSGLFTHLQVRNPSLTVVPGTPVTAVIFNDVRPHQRLKLA